MRQGLCPGAPTLPNRNTRFPCRLLRLRSQRLPQTLARVQREIHLSVLPSRSGSRTVLSRGAVTPSRPRGGSGHNLFCPFCLVVHLLLLLPKPLNVLLDDIWVVARLENTTREVQGIR